ncbi:MAG TPA: tyrosine-type recombinase/integrase [Verrucomicrobiae bacterium]|nr:tyrosine-type recombinase/integrase [Verrucomicrobiae bacterium]
MAKGPAGERIVKECEAYHLEYTDAQGRTRRRKAGLTAAAAKDALRQAEANVLAEKNGVPTQRADEIRMSDLLEAYIKALRPRVSASHCQKTERAIKALLAELQAVYLKDVKPCGVDGYMARLQDEGLAGRTVNAPLIAIKALLNWAVNTRRILYNPINCVRKVSEQEKTRRRRALSEEEISRLLSAALDGPRRRAVRRYQNRPRKDGTYKPVPIPLHVQARLASEGRTNVLAYRLMLEVGLRRGEAQALTWADVDWAACTLTTRPEWVGNKNGKRETLPLTAGLMDALKRRKAEANAADGDRVVNITDRTLDHLNDDLVTIGLAKRVPLDKKGNPIPLGEHGRPVSTPEKWIVDKRDSSGRTLDLHALRHTFGTRLGATPGIDPKTVQTLMRHSDPRMTFGVYVHSDKGRLKDAVAALPELKPAILKDEVAVARKTGTDDRDEPPDDEPSIGGNPPRNRQEKGLQPHKVFVKNELQQQGSKLLITGSEVRVLQDAFNKIPAKGGIVEWLLLDALHKRGMDRRPYPVNIGLIDAHDVIEILERCKLTQAPRWLPSLILIHVLKHVRYYQNLNGKQYLLRQIGMHNLRSKMVDLTATQSTQKNLRPQRFLFVSLRRLVLHLRACRHATRHYFARELAVLIDDGVELQTVNAVRTAAVVGRVADVPHFAQGDYFLLRGFHRDEQFQSFRRKCSRVELRRGRTQHLHPAFADFDDLCRQRIAEAAFRSAVPNRCRHRHIETLMRAPFQIQFEKIKNF